MSSDDRQSGRSGELKVRGSSDPGAVQFAESHTGILTTLRADGAPVALPVWFVVDDRTICFMSFEGMKKLARMFYERAASYGEAIDAGDRPALAAALKRNVAPQIDEWREVGNLADYAFQAKQGLEEQQLADLLAGRITFPIAFEDGEASK